MQKDNIEMELTYIEKRLYEDGTVKREYNMERVQFREDIMQRGEYLETRRNCMKRGLYRGGIK